jgi:hypothetical protein
MKSFFQIFSPRSFYPMALLAVLAGVGTGTAVAQSSPGESFNRAFWASVERSANEACLKSGKESSKGKLPDEMIAKYCDCTIKASFSAISTTEALKAYLAGQMSPDLKAKLQERALTCARETFPSRGASTREGL